MKERKDTGNELRRQLWEPQGVISQTQESNLNAMDYGTGSKEPKKGGQLTLEVEEVFHNRGIMENLQSPKE